MKKMESIAIQNDTDNQIISEEEIMTGQSKSPFIEANTKEVSLDYLKKDCIIPTFKDLECTLAHHEFIQTTEECVKSIFEGQQITKPVIRASHKVLGRIPSAIDKPVKALLENEKTQYFERMMFKIDVPSINEIINGNSLNLSIIAVRAYNQENLYSNKNYEKFKIGIGFLNFVCTNMCLSSDGVVEELRASSVKELKSKITGVLSSYEIQNHLNNLKLLSRYYLTEKQFAKFLGRCRMYYYLSKVERKQVPSLLLNDGQINAVTKGYYEDENFSRNSDGTISLWCLYNLLTGSVKSSYIDTFLSRNVNAYELVNELGISMKNNIPNWFLDN
ncbi:DUF3871 family protein [Litoribaculum gwangyangense]|uniref:DUF3871 family protein n=1 Tax=Litoribaculum gwangyangense TaxID=1130722 RepID=A0ABP9C214_9FLAO